MHGMFGRCVATCIHARGHVERVRCPHWCDHVCFWVHEWLRGTAGPRKGQAPGQPLLPPSPGIICLCYPVDPAFCTFISCRHPERSRPSSRVAQHARSHRMGPRTLPPCLAGRPESRHREARTSCLWALHSFCSPSECPGETMGRRLCHLQGPLVLPLDGGDRQGSGPDPRHGSEAAGPESAWDGCLLPALARPFSWPSLDPLAVSSSAPPGPCSPRMGTQSDWRSRSLSWS